MGGKVLDVYTITIELTSGVFLRRRGMFLYNQHPPGVGGREGCGELVKVSFFLLT